MTVKHNYYGIINTEEPSVISFLRKSTNWFRYGLLVAIVSAMIGALSVISLPLQMNKMLLIWSLIGIVLLVISFFYYSAPSFAVVS